MNLQQRLNVVRDCIARLTSARAGILGAAFVLGVFVWKGVSAISTMDFMAQHWQTFTAFMQTWGFFVGLLAFAP